MKEEMKLPLSILACRGGGILIDANGTYICEMWRRDSDEMEAAKTICRAVNNHERLVEAAQEIVDHAVNAEDAGHSCVAMEIEQYEALRAALEAMK